MGPWLLQARSFFPACYKVISAILGGGSVKVYPFSRYTFIGLWRGAGGRFLAIFHPPKLKNTQICTPSKINKFQGQSKNPSPKVFFHASVIKNPKSVQNVFHKLECRWNVLYNLDLGGVFTRTQLGTQPSSVNYASPPRKKIAYH